MSGLPFRACLAVSGLALAIAAAPLAAVTVEPERPVERFRAVVTQGGQSAFAFGGPERYSIRDLSGQTRNGTVLRDGGTETSRFSELSVSVIRRNFAAAPDAFTGLDLIDTSLDVLLARARAGTTTLTPVRTGGRAALRGRLRLPANDCAALREGTKTIDLDARTLLPLRIVIQRTGARVEIETLRYPSVNRPLPAGAFRPPAVGSSPFRDDRGFRRTSPARAADNLSYAPELPATVPAGFKLAVAGWAPRSATIGPEGSIPPHRELFAAVYARGTERIEITQRLGRPGDWDVSPFGAECQPLGEVKVDIAGSPAIYAIGAQTSPHLYWREGRILHTLSGPYPRRTLVEIAESLTSVP